MKLRWLSSAAVLPVVLASPALAAPPAPVPYTWTGFYAGANVGAAWGRFGSSTAVDCSGTPPGIAIAYLCDPFFSPGGSTAVNAAGSGSFNATGFTGGFQAGYNWQVQSIVFGVETDIGAFRLDGSRQGRGTVDTFLGTTPFTITTWANTDWLYTLRGRLGATVRPDLFVYATGGLAVTRLNFRTSYADDNGITGNWGTDGIKVGYAVGAGAEYGLSRDWTVKVEYLYLNFGDCLRANGIISDRFGYGQAIGTKVDLTAQIARIGVNRRF